MFEFFKKKRAPQPKIKGLYILTFTAEEMPEETLNNIIPIADKMLADKNPSFAALKESMGEETPLHISNRLYNAEMHNPQTMQIALDTWLIGTHDVAFEPNFGENFFPHAMSDPQRRENFFLYYFELEK